MYDIIMLWIIGLKSKASLIHYQSRFWLHNHIRMPLLSNLYLGFSHETSFFSTKCFSVDNFQYWLKFMSLSLWSWSLFQMSYSEFRVWISNTTDLLLNCIGLNAAFTVLKTFLDFTYMFVFYCFVCVCFFVKLLYKLKIRRKRKQLLESTKTA
jgi:hypothetical protein